MIEGENKAFLSSFDYYEASLMDEDNFVIWSESCRRWKYREVQIKVYAHGLSQKKGINYEETFAPMARYTSIRAIMALDAKLGWKLHQMDMKIAFLNGVVEEEVYVEQPLGFETHDWQSHVCRLKKALYSLKKVSRTWYVKIDTFLMSLGFTKGKVDPNLCDKIDDDDDDLIHRADVYER